MSNPFSNEKVKDIVDSAVLMNKLAETTNELNEEMKEKIENAVREKEKKDNQTP